MTPPHRTAPRRAASPIPSRLVIASTAALIAALLAGCQHSAADASADSGRSARSSASVGSGAPAADAVLAADADKVVATLDPRFGSYNIEMVEVTGGTFWKPYDSGPGKVVRPPIDLTSTKLRNLAKALGPAYIRVSGSWANSTYFDPDGAAGATAPEGFESVLTGDQWKGVGDFARAVDGLVVTSFASSPGAFDAAGVWKPDQARLLLQYSKDHDVPVYAAELFNEPSLNLGMPPGYDAAAFARDFATLERLAEEVAPDLKLAGPGAVEDVTPIAIPAQLAAEDMVSRLRGRFDVFSYHFYPKVSERCSSKEGPDVALTSEFLSRVEVDKSFYERLRDAYEPGDPMWVTETAEAACGGDRWASTYRDVIRYVDNLGRLGDGDVVFHNTLAASDYGLLDEDGLVPRPDYWAAVLWARLMGPKVLAVKSDSAVPDLSVYAHCTAGRKGSVTYAVVNSSTTASRTVATASGKSSVHLLTSSSLDSSAIELNGRVLEAKGDGTIPALDGRPAEGAVEVPPASVAFVSADVSGAACN